jgi:serine/threonine-protein kinase
MNARVTGDPEAPRKLNPEIRTSLEEVILHAMERDPRQRYDSAGEMKRELNNLNLVAITHRDQRLKAPQVGRGKSHMVILVGALVVSWIALFLALYFIIAHKHH